MTIFRFALKRSFRSPLNILLLCVLPAGVVFLPAVEGWTLPMGFHFYGQLIMFAALLMVRAIVDDRQSGVLTRLASAPVRYFRYLSENLLAYGLLLVIQNAVVVALGVAVHGGRIASPVLLFVAFSCFSLASIAFALAGCSLFASREVAYGSLTTIIVLLSMVGGFYWPVGMMSEPLQKAALVTPTYWLLNAASVLQQGGPATRFVLSLAIMLLFAMAFLVVGSRRRME